MRAFSSGVSLPCSSMECEDRLAAVFELAEVLELLLDGADLDLVQVAGHLLAVAGDEGDGGAFVEQRDGGDQALEGNGDLLRDVQQHGRGKGFGLIHNEWVLSMISDARQPQLGRE